MVLEHQLTASYAAGSLGGTLGRLSEALRRLSRANSTGSRDEPGWAEAGGLLEPAQVAHLDQTLRLMADAWRSRRTISPKVSRIEHLLDQLKENALTNLAGEKTRPEGYSQYQLLAQVLDRLKAQGHPWT